MKYAREYRRIAVLTGAGVSAESGIPTFRAQDGLWENHRIEDVASPAGFARDPVLVHRFYNARRRHLLRDEIKPNKAHLALAEFEKKFAGEFLLITQNIDDLHERAGSQQLLHMHGELRKLRCGGCEAVLAWNADADPGSICPRCSRAGLLRPHVVWFGEMPLHMEAIYDALQGCDLFVAIGTSGHVYPAASFVEWAQQAGAHTVELNLEPSQQQSRFAEKHYGMASIVVADYFG